MFTSIEALKKSGFSGFLTVKKLWEDASIIPKKSGVYLVIDLNDSNKFLSKGVGGYFKQKDPNISLGELGKNWVNGSKVLYIGKAGGFNSNATLNSRLNQYLKFGQGKNIGHYGGRLIWQIEKHPELLIAWKVLESEEPVIYERGLINEFMKSYGKMPFANLI